MLCFCWAIYGVNTQVSTPGQATNNKQEQSMSCIAHQCNGPMQESSCPSMCTHFSCICNVIGSCLHQARTAYCSGALTLSPVLQTLLSYRLMTSSPQLIPISSARFVSSYRQPRVSDTSIGASASMVTACPRLADCSHPVRQCQSLPHCSQACCPSNLHANKGQQHNKLTHAAFAVCAKSTGYSRRCVIPAVASRFTLRLLVQFLSPAAVAGPGYLSIAQ